MAFLEYSFILSLLLILVSFLTLKYRRHRNNTTSITNWPIVGTIPGVLVNIHRVHDLITGGLKRDGGTSMVKVPWFGHWNILITADPANINHILSKNFANYPKGDKFSKIFDFLGDGILNADGKLWEINRKVSLSVLKSAGFQSVLETITWNKVEKGLLPVLESVCEHGKEVDLQEILQRFYFDTICKLFMDKDFETLSLDFPSHPCLKAMTEVDEALFIRHFMPPCLWKLLKLLRLGKEKKLSDGRRICDEYIYECLAEKQNEYNKINSSQAQDGKFMVYTAFMRALEVHDIDTCCDRTKFIRDTAVNMVGAGKETTTSTLCWFLYMVAKNPSVQEKILEEIHTHLEVKVGEKWDAEELGKMVYLHAALCESLRLFPAVPFNHKCPLQPDILPSGHKVDQNTEIILSFYSMGRMKSVWGEDCKEFKPERWITKSGEIKHEPTFKFASFNSGPRACVGKNMALCQLKIVSTAIIYRYRIMLVEGHPVLPAASMVLQMKHGLKVRLTKRREFMN
ncbi:hypothetical protein OSB04_un001467 [Centaurea solstitialis]|uniref:Cytochrome P450 n=1 Tax=Centaurea solstitialis TaxID=347529 RepID=A0AA38W4Z7_9ASTR|nr:hypothetical protein OSB04_un001467 [Centaurea solstitialis]